MAHADGDLGHNAAHDLLEAAYTAWTSYTPTLTNLTLGNGTVTATYKQVGKTVFFRIEFLLGSSSAVGTTPSFTPPVVPVATRHQVGSASFEGTFSGAGACSIFTGAIVPLASDGTLLSNRPFTWATGNRMVLGGMYEAA